MTRDGLTKVTLYTDGACSGNPGPGGFGSILLCGEKEKRIAGGERETTNNRMELSAVIAGLSALTRPCDVTVYSDSRYVVDAIDKGWAKKWKKNGWMRNKTDRALNPDLWEKLLSLCETHSVRFVWVKGHADNPYNNECDRLAVEQARKYGEKG